MPAKSLMPESFGPLQGVRIISTGTLIAQPFAGQLAATYNSAHRAHRAQAYLWRNLPGGNHRQPGETSPQHSGTFR